MSDLLNQASLVMIPSGYKEDVVYSQIPTDGSGDLSFTRASNGTRTNSAGLVEVCPWNNWGGSDNFSSTYWTGYNLTPTTGTTSDIYGNSSTVYKLIGSVTNSYSFINRSSDGSQNTAFSVYAKPNGYTKIGISNRSSNAWNFVVDLVTKVVSNTYDPSSIIVSVNVIDAIGDWKRIEVVVSTGVQYNLHPLPSNFNSTNFDNVTLNGTDGVWVMGAQVNVGTIKPYFPTTDRLNVPRLTYQNGGGGCPSLLLEKQSTNVLSYSQEFDNAQWTKQLGSTITANTTISPDGTQNADTLTIAPVQYLFQGISATSGTTYTISVYVKVASGTKEFIMSTYSGTGGNNFASSTMTATTTWQRFTFSFTASTSATTYIYPVNVDAYVGGDFYIYGAQCEPSSYATSYIPTTSSSATRVADACYKTGISSLIGASAGAMFIDINNPNPSQYLGTPPANTIFGSINSGDYLNNFHFTTDDANLYLYCNASGGALQAVIGTTMPTTSKIKMAVTYTSSAIKFFVNGVLIGTDTSFTLPSSMSRVDIGHMGGQPDSQRMRGSVNEFLLFTTALTDAEAIALTTL